jgi:hypothetical protein
MTIATTAPLAPLAPPSPAAASPVETVMNLALGYLVSRSLHVATELRIADHLGAGAASAEDLAPRVGADPAALRRLLRTLAAHGVFEEDAQGRFANTPAAALLQSGVIRDGVLLCCEVTGDGSWWNAVGALRHSVTRGEPAFDRQHGMGFFDYMRLHPECGAWFDRGLANFAAAENPAIASAYDFARFGRIVDVGGGQGGLLAEILARHAGVRAVLFDLPEVVADPAYLVSADPARWSAVGGDFFESVPAGADAYVLERIAHDWSDSQCVQILRRCREAMHAGSKLLVVDAVIPPGNAPHPGKVMDILMMVFAQGRERTADEFGALLHQAGLRMTATLATASTLGIVEAVRA